MSRQRVRLLPFLGLLLLGSLLTPRLQAQKIPPKKDVYDEAADANQDLADALAKARKDHQRVLVVYGANW